MFKQVIDGLPDTDTDTDTDTGTGADAMLAVPALGAFGASVP